MRRNVALVLAAASVAALAGCDGVVGARMTFNDTEKAKVTEIVLDGGSGDVVVTAGSATETRVTRVIQGSTSPGPSYKLTGSTLTLATDCGRDCHVSYDIATPAGVAVRGDVRSGDLNLIGTGAVDLKLTAGDVVVEDASGPVSIEATSGDLTVTGAPSLKIDLTSGDVLAQDIAGPIQAQSTSGDMNLALAKAASVTASVHSGDLDLMVPDGSYQIRTRAGSGDEIVDGLRSDPRSANVIDLRSRSGDLSVTAR